MKFTSGSFMIHDENKFKNNYLVGKAIGSGHFTEVRHCRNPQTAVVKAVKIYKKELMNEFQNDRLHNEILILNKLKHPNILKLHELFEDDKRFYLVMECLIGGELYDRLNEKGQFDEEEAQAIIL